MQYKIGRKTPLGCYGLRGADGEGYTKRAADNGCRCIAVREGWGPGY